MARMTRQDARRIHEAVDAAIKTAIDGLEGVTLGEPGRMRYDPETGECKVTTNIIMGGAEDAEDALRVKWERDTQHTSLEGVPYRFTFDGHGEAFEVLEYRYRSRKYPVVARSLRSGKRMKWTAATVLASWNSRKAS